MWNIGGCLNKTTKLIVVIFDGSALSDFGKQRKYERIKWNEFYVDCMTKYWQRKTKMQNVYQGIG